MFVTKVTASATLLHKSLHGFSVRFLFVKLDAELYNKTTHKHAVVNLRK